MVIGRIGAENSMPAAQPAVGAGEDAVSRNLKKQIMSQQEKLKELSNNGDISMEEKMKRRQEISQEIARLNQELRQHQIDVKAEERQERMEQAKQSEQRIGRKDGTNKADTGLSGDSQQALVGADTALKQARACDTVEISLEGRARVLASEIELDEMRGVDTTRKREELSDAKERMEDVSAYRSSTLSDAAEDMDDTRRVEEEDRAAEQDGEEEKKDGEN